MQSHDSNQLLMRFPDDVRAFLAPHLSRVALARGLELQSPHRVASHVYFPISAVLALRHQAEPGRTLVVALIDRLGMAGASAVLGADATSTAVLVEGEAWRLEAGHLLGEFERSAALRQLLLGWLQVVMTQAVQSATCLRFHSPEQRLCLRLAQLAPDPAQLRIALTQKQLGELVGVRRERANELLGKLLECRLISQQRGRIQLLDRDGIARLACGCAAVLADALARAARPRS